MKKPTKKKVPKLYRAHVLHMSRARRKSLTKQPQTIEYTVEIPFVPVPGMMLRPAPEGEVLKVTGVVWDGEDPDELLVFTATPEPELLHSFAHMKHEGWRAKINGGSKSRSASA
jgi:hypothetical protein